MAPVAVVVDDEAFDLGLLRQFPHYVVDALLTRLMAPLDLAVGLRRVRRGQDEPEAFLQAQACGIAHLPLFFQ